LVHDLLSYNWNVVLRLTSDNARRATGTRREIDSEAPLIERMLTLFVHLLWFVVPTVAFAVPIAVSSGVRVTNRMAGRYSSRADNAGSRKLTVQLIGEVLNGNEVTLSKSTNDFDWAARKRQGGGAGRERLRKKAVHTSVTTSLRVPTVRGVALSEWDSHDARMYVLSHIRWNVRLSVVGTNDNSIALLETKSLGGVWMNLSPRAPYGLRDRIRQLLHPGLIGGATIEGLH
jgi:hypothetical protein